MKTKASINGFKKLVPPNFENSSMLPNPLMSEDSR